MAAPQPADWRALLNASCQVDGSQFCVGCNQYNQLSCNWVCVNCMHPRKFIYGEVQFIEGQMHCSREECAQYSFCDPYYGVCPECFRNRLSLGLRAISRLRPAGVSVDSPKQPSKEVIEVSDDEKDDDAETVSDCESPEQEEESPADYYNPEAHDLCVLGTLMEARKRLREALKNPRDGAKRLCVVDLTGDA